MSTVQRVYVLNSHNQSNWIKWADVGDISLHVLSNKLYQSFTTHPLFYVFLSLQWVGRPTYWSSSQVPFQLREAKRYPAYRSWYLKAVQIFWNGFAGGQLKIKHCAIVSCRWYANLCINLWVISDCFIILKRDFNTFVACVYTFFFCLAPPYPVHYVFLFSFIPVGILFVVLHVISAFRGLDYSPFLTSFVHVERKNMRKK